MTNITFVALAFFIASLMQTLLENVYFENIQAVAGKFELLILKFLSGFLSRLTSKL